MAIYKTMGPEIGRTICSCFFICLMLPWNWAEISALAGFCSLYGLHFPRGWEPFFQVAFECIWEHHYISCWYFYAFDMFMLIFVFMKENSLGSLYILCL